MRGYLFSLEALIAITVLLFSVTITAVNLPETDNEQKSEKIYEAINILREENKLALSNNSVEVQLKNILDFDVSVTGDCENKRILDYLLVSGPNEFKIIRVCY